MNKFMLSLGFMVLLVGCGEAVKNDIVAPQSPATEQQEPATADTPVETLDNKIPEMPKIPEPAPEPGDNTSVVLEQPQQEATESSKHPAASDNKK